MKTILFILAYFALSFTASTHGISAADKAGILADALDKASAAKSQKATEASMESMNVAVASLKANLEAKICVKQSWRAFSLINRFHRNRRG